MFFFYCIFKIFTQTLNIYLDPEWNLNGFRLEIDIRNVPRLKFSIEFTEISENYY